MIVCTAPGRCGILGNPTDMYGGSVISCSTAERARCEIHDSDRLMLTAVGGESQILETADDLAPRGDRLDLAKAVLKGLKINPETHRFHLMTDTTIPMQAGLAGSTALVAAVHGAVTAFLGIRLNPYERAEAIRFIEYEIMGVVCGFQDQYMAVFGGLNYMDFRDKGSHLSPETQPYATVEPLREQITAPIPLLLAHTGIKHLSGAVHKPIRQRWLDGDTAVREGYLRIAELARRSKTLLLDQKWEQLADAMNENQRIQFELGGSGAVCDRLIAVALANGSIGAKLAGAGHGGTILVLTREPERTAQALRDAGAGSILTPAPSPGLQITLE